MSILNRYRLPDVSDFNSEQMAQILESSTSANIPILMLVSKDHDASKNAPLEAVLQESARALKGRVLCARNAVGPEGHRDNSFRFLKDVLGLEDSDLPALRLMAKNPAAKNRNSAVLKYYI